MSADDLLFLPHDQIEYEKLDEPDLFWLATQTLDLFIATSALAALSSRGARGLHGAALASEKVLTNERSDRHIKAFALKLLFTDDRAKALHQMRRLVADCDDEELLGAMVQNVMSDLEVFTSGGPAQDFARSLTLRVKQLDVGKFPDRDELDAFLGRFD